jgi:hypothetical protein
MYYDYEKGVKRSVGLFSARAVAVLAVVLLVCGVYMAFDWLAPEIFASSAAEKSRIEDEAQRQPAAADSNKLRIPIIGLEVEIVDKNTDGKIQLTKQGDKLILSGRHRVLAVTPTETLRLSPLALLGDLQAGNQIFVDLSGSRTLYKTTEIQYQVKPQAAAGSDLTIYALNDDGSQAAVAVTAEKVGVVKPK